MQFKAKLKDFWDLIWKSISEFNSDRCMSLAAALSYYTLFSLAPLLIIVIASVSLFWGKAAATGEIFAQIKSFVGAQHAATIQGIIERAYQPAHSWWANIIGMITLVIGATSVMTQLQTSLNTIWNVKAKVKSGILKMIRDRLLSFALILAIGFLLLVSFILNAILMAVSKYFSQFLPEAWLVLGRVIEIVFSFSVITALFAMIFKFLPDAKIPWRVVWLGSFITATLFNIGKYLIGLYLGHSTVASVYGSAGAVVLLILWVNYSSLILFFGAELTQVHAQKTGHPIRPVDYAVEVRNVQREVPQHA